MEVFDYETCKGTFTIVFLEDNTMSEYSIGINEKSLNCKSELVKSMIEHEEGDIYELRVDNYITKIKLVEKNITIKKIIKGHNYYIHDISGVENLNDTDIYYKYGYKVWENYMVNSISYKIIYGLKNYHKDYYTLFEKFLYEEIFLEYKLENYIVAMVPSHWSNYINTNNSIARMIDFIADNTVNYNGKSLLIRNKTIEPQKNMNYDERNNKIHLESIIKNKEIDIVGKNIIILDDIVTSGSSISACKDILLNNGANKVLCFAFAKTIRGRKYE